MAIKFGHTYRRVICRICPDKSACRQQSHISRKTGFSVKGPPAEVKLPQTRLYGQFADFFRISCHETRGFGRASGPSSPAGGKLYQCFVGSVLMETSEYSAQVTSATLRQTFIEDQ